MSEFIVTEYDIKEAYRCLNHDKIERSLQGVFCGIVFCLLSIGQLYKTQLNIYRTLLYYGFVNANSILLKRDTVKLIIKQVRFPSSIWRYIIDLCEKWNENENYFLNSFVKSTPEKVKNIFELREELIKKILGFGYKTSSLFLCLWGVEDVVTIDVWVVRFLKEQGFDIHYIYDRRGLVGGLSKSMYLEYEEIMRKKASEYNLSPAVFQCVVWSKYSSWNKKDKEQLFLPFEEKIGV